MRSAYEARQGATPTKFPSTIKRDPGMTYQDHNDVNQTGHHATMGYPINPHTPQIIQVISLCIMTSVLFLFKT